MAKRASASSVRFRFSFQRSIGRAMSADGSMLCHGGMAKTNPADRVGHSGQAITLKDARGQHLYSEVKRRLVDFAIERDWAGLYSEATAVHPYSQKAILSVGSVETGVLLGWIPRAVHNDAATSPGSADIAPGRYRQSAVLFYKRTNDGSERAIYAPTHYAEMVEAIAQSAQLRGTITALPKGAQLAGRTRLHTEIEQRHNIAVIHVYEPGADLVEEVRAVRHHLFHHGLDAVYIDLPLEHPGTALVTDQVKELGASFAGVFPNTRADGDVLRMQSLHKHCIEPGEVQVASDHGNELLAFVLEDLGRASS